MRRLLVAALLLWSAIAACSVSSAAAPAARRNPPRFTRGTYFPTIVKQQRNGQVTTQQVYPGYKNGFPPPAWLYYGYPHSGDGSLSPGF